MLTLQATRPEYPSLLKEIASPPETLYCEGNLQLLSKTCFAIVGAREATDYGQKVAFEIAGELASRGVVVVSGFAHGIDAMAHRGALEAGGTTIAVLGAGLDVPYPKDHQTLRREIIARGLMVTELSEGTPALRQHFPARNRIISGLSRGVLVVEATKKSG
ncbi:MAG: DNA-processing protein DprA, partial [bacterium]|nr:DNA-processing protein DprA [bacterium]